MPRHTTNRNFRPCLDQFESKQLLSGGLLTQGTQALLAPVTVSSPAQHPVMTPDGTGKGVVIITD